MMIPLLFFICLTFYTRVAQGDMMSFKGHAIEPGRPDVFVIPKYTKELVPSWYPGLGRSFIDLSRIRFALDCSNTAGTSSCKDTAIQVMMFEAPKDQYWKSYWESGQFCCNAEAYGNQLCREEDIGTLILPSALSSAFAETIVVSPLDPADVRETYLSHSDISSTGVFVILFANCNQNSPIVTMSGTIESLDPYGYLPAPHFGSLPFYGTLNMLYFLFGVVWCIVCFYYSKDLISIQYWITFVLALGMLESTVMFSHLHYWNSHGVQDLVLLGTALSIGVSKRTMSRIVLQLVASGYGVVKGYVGLDVKPLMTFGASYFACSLFVTLFRSLPKTAVKVDDPNYDFLYLIEMAVTAIDVYFYFWIFSSLNKVLSSLSARKQGTKFVLYRNFRGVLLTALFLALLWLIYGKMVSMDSLSGSNDSWKYEWSVEALWELTYFVLFVTLAILWAPVKNNAVYASSIELTQLEDDEEFHRFDNVDEGEKELDAEYGGQLEDDFEGGVDPRMAVAKKA